jgi:HSP20 family molecular chaperone IbpA
MTEFDSITKILTSGINTYLQSQNNKTYDNFMAKCNINSGGYWEPNSELYQIKATNENENENENNYTYCVINLDLPGLDEKTIEIECENNKITILGNRKKGDQIIIHSDIIYGKFKKEIIIPINITDKDSIKMNYEKGILEIKINQKKEIKNKFTLKFT